MPYNGSIDLISGIRQKNNGKFALVDASAVRVEDDDSSKKYKSLSEKLAEIDASTVDVDTKIENAIRDLYFEDEAIDKQFVTAVSETDGKIFVTRVQPEISDVDGLQDVLDSKQEVLSEGIGISIKNNELSITDEVYQNIVGSSGYTDLGTTLDVSYSSNEHKMETVLDNLADRVVNYSNRINSLEYEHFEVKSFTASPSRTEIGTSINSVILSWSITTPAGTNLISNLIKSSGDTDINVLDDSDNKYTYTNSSGVKSKKTWTINAKLNDLPAKTASASLDFMNKKYYGAKAEPASASEYNSEFIHRLTGELDTDRAGNFTVTAEAGQYIYFSIPVSYGEPSFKTGGMDVVLDKVGTDIRYYYDDNTYTSYNIYKSDQAGLGSTTYTVS